MRENHVLYNRTFPQNQESNSSKRQNEAEARKTSKNTFETPKRSIGMMVSLDHTIYFHRPREVKADEWMCTEMETPWSGEGRGLVMQRIWNKKGRLVATCVQEVSLAVVVSYLHYYARLVDKCVGSGAFETRSCGEEQAVVVLYLCKSLFEYSKFPVF